MMQGVKQNLKKMFWASARPGQAGDSGFGGFGARGDPVRNHGKQPKEKHPWQQQRR
jgi:hypothetical protein